MDFISAVSRDIIQAVVVANDLVGSIVTCCFVLVQMTRFPIQALHHLAKPTYDD